VALVLAEFDTLQRTLGITFKNPQLLQQSLVHRSYLNENPDFTLPSNERLEFLGDALLGFVIAEELYSKLPHLAEGDLTKLRAALVRRETLASLASSLRLGDHLYLGHGEEKSGGRHRQSNLCNVLEAVLGAVLIDQGFAVAKDFILRLFGGKLKKILKGGLIEDYKSKLQELVQAEQRTPPVYRVVDTVSLPHSKVFTVEVMVGDVVCGRGSGNGKKAAEQAAAQMALGRMGLTR
jgi:ribonuclease-3